MIQKTLAILICTIEGREEQFARLKGELDRQIVQLRLNATVQSFLDKRGDHTTGHKRQVLLEESEGLFSAFVDDDDWVSNTYVLDVLTAINDVDVDVVGFFGEVHFSDQVCRMVHSTVCSNWTEDSQAFYRPPNHLNPVRTSLARQIPYEDITVSEDHHWSVAMKEAGLLKREVFLGHKPLYIYRCGGERRGL